MGDRRPRWNVPAGVLTVSCARLVAVCRAASEASAERAGSRRRRATFGVEGSWLGGRPVIAKQLVATQLLPDSSSQRTGSQRLADGPSNVYKNRAGNQLLWPNPGVISDAAATPPGVCALHFQRPVPSPNTPCSGPSTVRQTHARLPPPCHHAGPHRERQRPPRGRL